MRPRTEIPQALGDVFSTQAARRCGVAEHRLRAADLEHPFYGVAQRAEANSRRIRPEAQDRFDAERLETIELARAFATRMGPRTFFSHETAALLWGAPVTVKKGDVIHVCTLTPGRGARARGVRGHEVLPDLAEVTELDGVRLTTPSTTWAMVGHLSTEDLVVLGDYFAREWRPGYGRPHVGRAALASVGELGRGLSLGRRRGAVRLREALGLVRADSWSPMETRVRLALVRAGLPEPELNVDVFDGEGSFLACVDLCYPRQRIAIEYLGMLHGERYARDVDRVEALRAAGWTVIQVTWPLLIERPTELVRRVARELRRR